MLIKKKSQFACSHSRPLGSINKHPNISPNLNMLDLVSHNIGHLFFQNTIYTRKIYEGRVRMTRWVHFGPSKIFGKLPVLNEGKDPCATSATLPHINGANVHTFLCMQPTLSIRYICRQVYYLLVCRCKNRESRWAHNSMLFMHSGHIICQNREWHFWQTLLHPCSKE